jgi:hypothetical protein
MSYNTNGYAEPKRLVLGIGDLYVNDVFVGNLKGAVTFTDKREAAFQRPGNLIADLKAEPTSQEVMLEAEICDLKLSQLRTALGIHADSVAESRDLKVRDIIQLNGTTPVSLTKTALAGTVTVKKLDRSVGYALTTDYTFSTNQVTRVPAGDIADGENVIVEYEYANADALVLQAGGEARCFRHFRVDYVAQGCDGTVKALWQLTLFRAIAPTEFEIAFNERASGDYTVHNITFRALVDLTKPEGSNLYEWIEEDGAL